MSAPKPRPRPRRRPAANRARATGQSSAARKHTGRRGGNRAVTPSKPAGPERIQKVLAAAGFGSRRSCEELVLDGRVTVNGKQLTELPILVAAHADDIRVDGMPIRSQRHVYFLLNKPRGVISTNSDPQGRKRAIDLLFGVRERVFPVGRLDADSTGLLLMTNDGDLADRLTHPRYGVEKTYEVEVAGRLTPEDLDKLHRGIWLDGGRTQPARVRVVHRGARITHLHIALREGRNREVRRILARLGHNVRRLRRIRMGPLVLRGVGVGRFRPLNAHEIEALRRAGVGQATQARESRTRRATARAIHNGATGQTQKSRGRRITPPPT